MKLPAWTLVAVTVFALAPPSLGQTAPPPPDRPDAVDAFAAEGDALSAEEIESLIGPIALYPDVLLAQILPAATFPMDIVQAARWLRSKPDLKTLLDQPWDASVLALCNYPDVLYRMDEDLDWTNALGTTFLNQQSELMDAIQRLRGLARDNGALRTTPQQTVVVEQQTIRIVPAEPQVVYVPQYSPQVVYVDDDDDFDGSAVAAAAIGFGAGLALGAWLDTDCDWYHRGVVYCRPGYWGGWGYRGRVAWDNDWVAWRGRRTAGLVGEKGGIVVGRGGAIAWGENGRGTAWRRPTHRGGPVYTGRYSSYRNRSPNININNTNVNIGNRVNTGNIGNRTNVNNRGGTVNRLSNNNLSKIDRGYGQSLDRRRDVARDKRPAGAFDTQRNARDIRRDSDRGALSRQPSPRGSSGTLQRPTQPQRRDTPRPSSTSRGGFGDSRGKSEVKRSSSRGSGSRGVSRGGGGGRGGRR